MNPSKVLQIFASLFAVILIAVFAIGVSAQSGRRSNKPSQTTSPPVPVATPSEALAKPSSSPSKPRFTLTVGIDNVDSFSRVPTSAEGIVLESCVAQLNQSGSVGVAGTIRNMGRSDAMKKAKASAEVHVVYMRVEVERIGINEDRPDYDARDIVVQFIVYAPTTGKVVAQGRAYAQKGNRSIIPTNRTGGIMGEHWYTEAGRNTAEKILASLRLPTEPIRIP